MRRSLLTSLSVALLAMGAASPVFAASSTSQFSPQVNIFSSCRIAQAPNLAFGAYNPLAPALKEVSNTLTIRCTPGTTAVYSLSQGLNAGTGSTCAAPVRNMRSSGGGTLAYAIKFPSTGRPVVCANSANQTHYFGLLSFEQTISFRGELPPGQNTPVGTYADTVTVVVSF